MATVVEKVVDIVKYDNTYIDIASDKMRTSENEKKRHTYSSSEGNLPPCGGPYCLASKLEKELQLQRQIEDKHYSNLINLIIGSTLTTCVVIITALINLMGKH